jgi:hypothetical protein
MFGDVCGRMRDAVGCGNVGLLDRGVHVGRWDDGALIRLE